MKEKDQKVGIVNYILYNLQNSLEEERKIKIIN